MIIDVISEIFSFFFRLLSNVKTFSGEIVVHSVQKFVFRFLQ